MKKDLDIIKDEKQVVGWLGSVEVDNLYHYAEIAPTNKAFEIGSFCGKSAVTIGLALKERDGSLICVDRAEGGWEFYPYSFPSGVHWWVPSVQEEFKKNVKRFGLDGTVVKIHGDSREILPNVTGKFGLIFIDGDHSVGGCLHDALWAYDHIEPSGYIVFHDYHNVEWGAGVTATVDALRKLWQGEWSFCWISATFKKS
jgi:MMP 1-O-methyltransferase